MFPRTFSLEWPSAKKTSVTPTAASNKCALRLRFGMHSVRPCLAITRAFKAHRFFKRDPWLNSERLCCFSIPRIWLRFIVSHLNLLRRDSPKIARYVMAPQKFYVLTRMEWATFVFLTQIGNCLLCITRSSALILVHLQHNMSISFPVSWSSGIEKNADPLILAITFFLTRPSLLHPPFTDFSSSLPLFPNLSSFTDWPDKSKPSHSVVSLLLSFVHIYLSLEIHFLTNYLKIYYDDFTCNYLFLHC